ncbi:hypothetical protein HY404_02025 [Candidatus Microgenomates bacterium]|nr:hypothetical protein [Candidatus Microgenomates bacterium]
MKLPSITEIIGKKETPQEVFVSFVIGKNWIQAGLWRTLSGQGELMAAGTTDAWQDSESFVQAADDSLSAAVGSMNEPPEEILSVVFGLPNFWIEDGNIVPEKLAHLRLLCEKLELKPKGFVVVPEAIIHFLKNKEGSPLSAILVGIEEEEAEVLLVRSGKIVNSHLVSRSISLADDITEGLSRFGVGESLPARLVLYNRNNNELEEARQNLVNWEWPSAFFLHTPRIERLTSDELLSAISVAASTEAPVQPELTTATEPAPLKSEPETFQGRRPVVEEEIATEKVSSVTPEPQLPVAVTPPVEDFGFQETHEEVVEPAGADRPVGAGGPAPIKSGSETGSKLNSLFNAVSAKSGFLGKLKIWLILGGLTILVFTLVWYFVPKAQLTIYIAPKKIEEKLTLQVDPTGGSGDGIVAGRTISSTVEGEKTTSTTGSKTVGDRAKGEVIIFNNTAQPKTFPAHTILVGPNGLKFSLDSQVTVASASGILPNIVLGQAKAVISAADIGTQYNLASGNSFAITNFSTNSFAAKNDNVFTGGSSREVPAVAKEDRQKLETDLLAELTDKFKTDIRQKVSGDETVINESIQMNIVRRSFSHNVGEEAQTLKLNLEAEGIAVTIPHDQLNSQLLTVLRPKVPEKFNLEEGDIAASFSSISQTGEKKEKNKVLTINVTAQANLLPQINQRQLVSQLAGKSQSEVKTKLAALPGYSRTSIKFSPRLPFLSDFLPQKSDNITIKVVAEQ